MGAWIESLQAVGGTAGVIALVWQIVETVRRRRQRRYPPELRVALLAALDVAHEVISEARNRDWTHEHAHPVQVQLHRLAAIPKPSLTSDRIGALGDCLSRMHTYSVNATDTAGRAARHNEQQHRAARDAKTLAAVLLRKIG